MWTDQWLLVFYRSNVLRSLQWIYHIWSRCELTRDDYYFTTNSGLMFQPNGQLVDGFTLIWSSTKIQFYLSYAQIMKNIGTILLAISLSAVKSNLVPKFGVKNTNVGAGKGFPVVGRIIIDQWYLEGPFWVRRPGTGKSLPKSGARQMKKASLSKLS